MVIIYGAVIGEEDCGEEVFVSCYIFFLSIVTHDIRDLMNLSYLGVMIYDIMVNPS